MAAITSRILIHNRNELKRLEKDYFIRLGQGETKTAKACGTELDELALHYKRFVGSRRIGLESATCREIEEHFTTLAEAMDYLYECILDQPEGIRNIYNTYQHGHAAWSLDGCKRSSDANNVIMQHWHDGHAADWFLPEPAPGQEADAQALGDRAVPRNRLDELVHLAKLMRRLAGIYQGLQAPQQLSDAPEQPRYDEKAALVFNLADLIKKQARPVLHTVGIATSIHEWATGDLNPPQERFQAAYRMWKERPRGETKRRF